MAVTLDRGKYLDQAQKAMDYENLHLSQTRHFVHSSTDFHHHQNPYLSILLQGKYVEKSENFQNNIQPGDILFRPKDYLHQNYFCNDNVRCFNVEFDDLWIENNSDHSSLPNRLIQLKVGMVPMLVQMLMDFTQYDQHELIEDTVLELILQIDERPLALRQPWINKAVKILDNEVEVFHSLQSLSDRLFINPTYLSRGFKKGIGLTVGQYQIMSKLNKSFNLLMDSKKTIGEIGFAVGFYDDAHFIHSFKNFFKITPYRLRQRLKS